MSAEQPVGRMFASVSVSLMSSVVLRSAGRAEMLLLASTLYSVLILPTPCVYARRRQTEGLATQKLPTEWLESSYA